MKITLDTDVCKKKDFDVDVLLYLISVLTGSKITVNTFEKARQQRLIQLEELYNPHNPFPEAVSLTQTGEYIVDSAIAHSTTINKSERDLEELATRMQECFPLGKKPGYALLWRDSTDNIIERLKKFFTKYPSAVKYSNDDIVAATKAYVDSFNGQYTYMQVLRYFIWKNKVTGEEVVRGRIVGETERLSQLSAWLENNDEEKITNPDWDVKLC